MNGTHKKSRPGADTPEAAEQKMAEAREHRHFTTKTTREQLEELIMGLEANDPIITALHQILLPLKDDQTAPLVIPDFEAERRQTVAAMYRIASGGMCDGPARGTGL